MEATEETEEEVLEREELEREECTQVHLPFTQEGILSLVQSTGFGPQLIALELLEEDAATHIQLPLALHMGMVPSMQRTLLGPHTSSACMLELEEELPW